MSAHVNLPPVVIHSRDKNALVLCATIASRLGRPGTEFLMSELRRASLCAAESLPANVVSLGSRVTYRVNGLPPTTSTLVLPGEAHRSRHRLSVLAPLGTALLGLRVGARMTFQSQEGIESEVMVVGVEGSDPESENSKSALDRRLDQARVQTFPASDPVSVVCTAYPPELFNAEQ
jgi:regulator of nucleoside diphosphate kinase